MLTSFHPNAYFFWGKCFLLSEKTKVQSAKNPGFSVEKIFYLALFFCFDPEMKRACKWNLQFCVFLIYMFRNGCQFLIIFLFSFLLSFLCSRIFIAVSEDAYLYRFFFAVCIIEYLCCLNSLIYRKKWFQ